MLRRQPPAIVLRQQPTFGDCQQRVMGLKIVRSGKHRLVGGDQRQFMAIGKLQKPCLGGVFHCHAVPFEADIEAVAENRLERRQAGLGAVVLAGGKQRIEGAVMAAGQSDQAGSGGGQAIKRQRRGAAFVAQIEMRDKPDEAGKAFLARRQHKQRRLAPCRRAGGGLSPAAKPGAAGLIAAVGLKADRQLAADDRLDAGLDRLFGEFQRTEEIRRVGDGERRHGVGGGKGNEGVDRQRAFQQRIGRMTIEVNEVRSRRHRLASSSCFAPCKPAAPEPGRLTVPQTPAETGPIRWPRRSGPTRSGRRAGQHIGPPGRRPSSGFDVCACLIPDLRDAQPVHWRSRSRSIVTTAAGNMRHRTTDNAADLQASIALAPGDRPRATASASEAIGPQRQRGHENADRSEGNRFTQQPCHLFAPFMFFLCSLFFVASQDLGRVMPTMAGDRRRLTGVGRSAQGDQH